MRDCLVYPYDNFKEKIRVNKEIQNEIRKRYGKNKKFSLSDLGNCVMVEFKSEKVFF